MGVERTSLPPFPNPALSVHDHRRPRLESAHPPEVGAASDTGAGHQLRRRQSVLRFSELAQVLRDRPLEFLAGIAVLESELGVFGFSDTGLRGASHATLIRHYPDCNPPESRSTDTCRGAVEYLAFCAELGGPPLDLRHQFRWPHSLYASPPASP